MSINILVMSDLVFGFIQKRVDKAERMLWLTYNFKLRAC